jgi:hypothetical protein
MMRRPKKSQLWLKTQVEDFLDVRPVRAAEVLSNDRTIPPHNPSARLGGLRLHR